MAFRPIIFYRSGPGGATDTTPAAADARDVRYSVETGPAATSDAMWLTCNR
jgi:hypothetical protein